MNKNLINPIKTKAWIEISQIKLLGTFISAFSVLCFSDARHGSKCQNVCTNIAAAFLQASWNSLSASELWFQLNCFQFITFPIVIGFIWSIIWGVLFMTISRKWYISSIDNRFSYVDLCPCSRCWTSFQFELGICKQKILLIYFSLNPNFLGSWFKLNVDFCVSINFDCNIVLSMSPFS